MTWDELLERAKVITQALSILGPYVIWPALLWLWRIGHNLRALFIATPKILKALAIFANRERRGFDVDRRQLFYFRRLVHTLRNEARKQDWAPASQQVLEVLWQDMENLDKDIAELRDTAFRAKEVQGQREHRDAQLKQYGTADVQIEQGDLNALPLGPIEQVLKG